MTDQKDKTPLKLLFLEETNQVLFDLGDTKIYSGLIAGNFPDFAKIIPSESTINIDSSAEELIAAIKTAAIFARESANIVKFKIHNSSFIISANAAQVGENESQIDAKIKGASDDFAIAFNYRYLLDFLNCVTGEITIGLTTPTAPGVFQTSSDANFLHLIMPVRVQG